MNKILKAALGGLLVVSQAVAAGQETSGLVCTGGELAISTGPAFSAVCTGDFTLGASSVITAEESITLLATGQLWLAGTLVAPSIVLTAQANLVLTGGLFSGSPDSIPDVRAHSFAESPAATLSVFSDLVPRPVIDPVYGAVTFTQAVPLPTVEVSFAAADQFIFIPDGTVSPVPEPSRLALFAAGLGLVAWKRRIAGNSSRTAHATGNQKTILEN